MSISKEAEDLWHRLDVCSNDHLEDMIINDLEVMGLIPSVERPNAAPLAVRKPVQLPKMSAAMAADLVPLRKHDHGYAPIVEVRRATHSGIKLVDYIEPAKPSKKQCSKERKFLSKRNFAFDLAGKPVSPSPPPPKNMEVSKEIDVSGENLSVRTVDCQTEPAPQKVVLSAAAQTAVVVEGVLELCDMLNIDQLKKLSASVQRLLAQRLNAEKKVEQVVQTAGSDVEPPTPSSGLVADLEVIPPPSGFEDAPSEPISVPEIAEGSSSSETSSSLSSDTEKPLISSTKKKNRKKKKKSSPEVVTQCSGPVDSFSDDSIDTTPTESMAVTVEKLQQAKKNPDKVIGKRKWTQDKGTIKEKSFGEALADGLNVKPTVFIYQPPAARLQAKSKVKCPWTNFPSQTWLKLVEKHNITVETEQSVLDSMLVNYIKKGFHFNLNLWKKVHGSKLKNPYLTDLQGLLNAVGKNAVRERYVSYALWLKEMRAYSAAKVKPNWYKNE